MTVAGIVPAERGVLKLVGDAGVNLLYASPT